MDRHSRRACKYAELHGKRAAARLLNRPANVLGVSCAAGPACRSRSGTAVAANDVRRTEWRTATVVTPSRWRHGRQLGCRAEAGPHQLHTKVRRRSAEAPIAASRLFALVLPRELYPTGFRTTARRGASPPDHRVHSPTRCAPEDERSWPEPPRVD